MDMHHRVGTGSGPSGEHADRIGDAICGAVSRNPGPKPPEMLKTQSPYQAHFTYINVPASQENEPAGAPWQGVPTAEIRSRLS